MKIQGNLSQEKKKNWKDLSGKETTDDSQTHWDENGFLEIREEFEGTDDEGD